jgi:hypothetical protein
LRKTSDSPPLPDELRERLAALPSRESISSDAPPSPPPPSAGRGGARPGAGRKKKTETVEKPDDLGIPDEAIFATGFEAIHGVISVRLGEHWKLTKAEAASLGKAFVPVADRYFPDFMNHPLVMFGLVASGVYIPKLMTSISIAERDEKAKAAAKAPPVEPPPPVKHPPPRVGIALLNSDTESAAARLDHPADNRPSVSPS